jgi:CBS domain-containing protein
MSQSREGAGRVGAGVLAGRLAIPEARHPRAPEPTAQSMLARSGAPGAPIVGEDATVLDSLKLMAERDVAAVAVMSAVGLAGIFSERDHARNGLLGNRTAQDTPVGEVMSKSIVRVAPGDSARRCLALLSEGQTAHVAVLDRGRLVGLLSQTELLAELIAHLERIFHETELDQKLLFLRGTYSC